jgi:hypothetical protein
VDALGVTMTEGVHYTLDGAYLAMDPRHGKVDVTYTHGFLNVPAEIAELVCAVAYRMSTIPAGLRKGIQSEGADGQQVTWGSSAYAGVADLTPDEKGVIDRFFPARKTGRSVDIL